RNRLAPASGCGDRTRRHLVRLGRLYEDTRTCRRRRGCRKKGHSGNSCAVASADERFPHLAHSATRPVNPVAGFWGDRVHGHVLQAAERVPNAQNLADGPSLRNAATRRVWCVAIENFAERADAVTIDALCQRFQKGQRCRSHPVNAIMGEREWTEQPAPNRSLMIGGVALTHSASVAPHMTWLARR